MLNSTKEFPLHFIKFRNLHISFLTSLGRRVSRLQIMVHFKKMSYTFLGMSQSLYFSFPDRLFARELRSIRNYTFVILLENSNPFNIPGKNLQFSLSDHFLPHNFFRAKNKNKARINFTDSNLRSTSLIGKYIHIYNPSKKFTSFI